MTSSGQTETDRYMAGLEHPMKSEIEAVRRIVLESGEGITERIKWNAPSFCSNGDDRVTMNLRGKGYFLLIFHRGAKTRRDRFEFRDETGLLEWAAADRATLKIAGMEDVENKRELLARAVSEWMAATT